MLPRFGHSECCPEQGERATVQKWQMRRQKCARPDLEKASLDAKAERQACLNGITCLHHAANLPQLAKYVLLDTRESKGLKA